MTDKDGKEITCGEYIAKAMAEIAELKRQLAEKVKT